MRSRAKSGGAFPPDGPILRDPGFSPIASGVTALKKSRLVSVEEYLASEELSEIKHEYVDGWVHPIGGWTLDHSAISGNVAYTLLTKLRGTSYEVFFFGARVKIEQDQRTRIYYPDSQVVCGPVDGKAFFTEHPTLVTEVLGESTRRVDMVEKKEAYLAIPSLKVLLLVESEVKGVTVYRRSASGRFETELYDSGVIPLEEIGVALSFEEIYEGAESP